MRSKHLLPFILATAPAWAHHSFSAEFDGNRTIAVTGVLTKVEWTNPHTHLFLEVRDETGKVRGYRWESVPPVGMKRRGVLKEEFKLGDRLTISGYPDKDAKKFAGWAMRVKFPDGHFMRLPMNGRP